MGQVEPAARFVVVGNPDNRRVRMFQAALARLGQPPAREVAWLDLLLERARLEDALSPGCIVRFDSPGEDEAVMRQLLIWGARAMGESAAIDPERAALLETPHGEILYPQQRFEGFAAILARLDHALAQSPQHSALTPPAMIRAMFDKVDARAHLDTAGVESTPMIGALRGEGGYDALRALMRAADCARVFVKLRTGSSASGVVAYRVGPKREEAITSARLVMEGARARLFNALTVSRYTNTRQTRALMDALVREGVIVEQWVPKASLDGLSVDVRQVVIGGRARHAVVRASRSPMTNLHLGNARGDLDALIARAGVERWAQAQRLCERALLAFPGAHYAGLDVLFPSGFGAPRVIEINAFGDLLPGLEHEGHDTYAACIIDALDRAAQGAA